ncbi:response regulator, partial [Gemmatimonas sp.]|uniref:response regulator n=1 Tax=Gemmatimonas sp. TaxID=1962908 RepID=UPI003565B313
CSAKVRLALAYAEALHLAIPENAQRQENGDAADLAQRALVEREAVPLTGAAIPLDDRGQEVLGHVERRQLDVNDLVAEVVGTLGSHIPPAVSLSIVLSHAGPIIDGDAAQLRQVLRSLVSHAVASIGDGHGRVELSVSRDTFDATALADCLLGAAREPGPFAVISVRDTGVGVSADVQERLFDPFFSTKASGGGPVLAATLGIVDGHDGAIWVSSQENHGTTVSVLLPVVRGRTPVQDMPAIDALARAESGVILLIDDDTGARTAARRILTRVGYTVVEAANGREGLDHYDRMPELPRGLVLDVAMPIMGGAECLLELRARGCSAPVLFISGYDAEDVAGRHVRRGEARFLQKPYSARELLDALRDTLAFSM